MSYDFSLNKKQVGLLIAGSIALGILTFVAGLLAGMMMRASPCSTMSARPRLGNVPGGTPPSMSVTPLGIANKIKGAVSRNAASKPSSDQTKARSDTEKEAASQAEDAKKDAADAPSADIPTDTQDAETSAESGTRFSVEVESFVVKTKALNMANKLIAEGWSDSYVLMTGSGDEDHTCYLVQIGDYENQAKASLMASEFGKEKGIVAVVNAMPANMLEQRKIAE